MVRYKKQKQKTNQLNKNINEIMFYGNMENQSNRKHNKT